MGTHAIHQTISLFEATNVRPQFAKNRVNAKMEAPEESATAA